MPSLRTGRLRLVFEQIPTGGDRNFAYLLGDRLSRRCLVIDPSHEPDRVCERARVQGLEVEGIFNTHGHPDHTNGNARAQELTGAPILAWKGSSVGPDRGLVDDERVELGPFSLRFLHTPGHADDHLVLYVPEIQVALTGDLLFVGKIGGTANDADASVEYDSLQRLLREIPDPTTIWPGHDYGCRPSSTLALERRSNPFLLAEGLAEFLGVKKKSWPELKRGFGLR